MAQIFIKQKCQCNSSELQNIDLSTSNQQDIDMYMKGNILIKFCFILTLFVNILMKIDWLQQGFLKA